jgi:4-coumarate--CoA ligase
VLQLLIHVLLNSKLAAIFCTWLHLTHRCIKAHRKVTYLRKSSSQKAYLDYKAFSRRLRSLHGRTSESVAKKLQSFLFLKLFYDSLKMPYKSRWSIPIPDCSLPTFLFTSPSTDLGEKPCFLNASCPEERYFTRNSFRLWSQRFALGLHRSPGFKSGDRILVYSGNTLAFPVAFMGSLMAGGIFTGANPTFVARELANQLKDSGASYLLCVDDSLDTGIDAANLIGMDKSRIFVFNANVFEKSNQGQSAIKGCKYWGELIASAEDARDFQWEDLKRPGECHKTLALNYSSGTTGVPKGVEVTHYNYVSNTLQYNHLPTLWPDYKDRAAKCRWLCFLPMYHAMAQTIYLAGGLLRHIPVYIMPKFDFIAVLENVENFRITELLMVPPIAIALAKHPAVKNYDLSCIDSIGCGAAPLGSDISREVEKIWGGKLNLKQGWGMTE